MNLYNENELAYNVKWFNIKDSPPEFNKIAFYNNEIYLPIESLNLTPSNVIAYMTETNSGQALVTKNNRIYLSGQTILDMCSIAHPQQVNELEECISLLYEKAMEAEIIQSPVNQILL